MPLADIPPAVQAALVGAVVATIGGFGVSEWRESLQLRRERRRTLNRLLAIQLEIVHQLKRSRLEPGIAVIQEHLARRIGSADASAVVAVFDAPPIRALIQKMLDEKLSASLDAQYQEAVDKVAEDDPVLSHEMNGRNTVAQYRQFLAQYLDAMELMIGPPPDAAAKTMMSGMLEESFQASAIEDIRHDAELVARKLGTKVYRDTVDILARPIGPDEADFARDLEPLMAKLMTLGFPSTSAV